MGKFTSQGTKYSNGYSKSAAIGANLGKSFSEYQKEQRELEQAQQKAQQEQDYALERIDASAKHNMKLAALQNLDLVVAEPGEKGAFEVADGIWAKKDTSSSATASAKTILEYQKLAMNAQKQAAEQIADMGMELSPDEYSELMVKMTRNLMDNAGIPKEMQAPMLWSPQDTVDYVQKTEGKNNKGSVALYNNQTGRVEWINKDIAGNAHANGQLKNYDYDDAQFSTYKPTTETKKGSSIFSDPAVKGSALMGAAMALPHAGKLVKPAVAGAKALGQFAGGAYRGIAPQVGKHGTKALLRGSAAAEAGAAVNPYLTGYVGGKILGNVGASAMSRYNPEAYKRHGQYVAESPYMRAAAHPWLAATNKDYRQGNFTPEVTEQLINDWNL